MDKPTSRRAYIRGGGGGLIAGISFFCLQVDGPITGGGLQVEGGGLITGILWCTPDKTPKTTNQAHVLLSNMNLVYDRLPHS